MSDKQNAASASDAPAKKGRGGRRQMNPPSYDSTENLMSLVQNHRSATSGDSARQFTAEGFKASGGIDNLPPTTRGFMAADLILSLANDAQGDGDQATEAARVVGIVTSFVGDAEAIASQAARLANYSNIAAIEGIAPQKADESAADFIARVQKGLKASK